MTWAELSEKWRSEGLRYAQEINGFVARGIASNWTNGEPEPAPDTREEIVEAVLNEVRRANDEGNAGWLRNVFPPAWEPFRKTLDTRGQRIDGVVLLPDDLILLRTGDTKGRYYRIDSYSFDTLEGIHYVGIAPDKSWLAFATDDGVQLRRTWNGPIEVLLPWPNPTHPERVTQLIASPRGNCALLVTPQGFSILKPDGAIRLSATDRDLEEGEEPDYMLSMEHGAISRDGRYFVVGHQCSNHLVFDENGQLIADIGPHCEYPHFALFDYENAHLLANSCHLYNGETISVPVESLEGLKTSPYEDDERILLCSGGERVYAAVARPGEFIVGDAYGYVRAYDQDGKLVWQHFMGSTISGMDISADGKTLVIASYAGIVALIDLDTGAADPFQIGTATHRERFRWLFWKKEESPLLW